MIRHLCFDFGQNLNVEHSGVKLYAYLCGMNFTSQIRYNPETG